MNGTTNLPTKLVALALLTGAANAGAAEGLRQPDAYAADTVGAVVAPEAIAEPTAVREAQALEVVPPPVLLAPEPSPNRTWDPKNGSALTRPIGVLGVEAIADPRLVEQMAKVPEQFAIHNAARGRFGDWEAPLFDASRAGPRHAMSGFHFAAPAAYSRPLYFEQHHLERYGHHVGCWGDDVLAQSVISTAHFFASAAVLPYKMGAERPDECSYVLGSYRPGSCNPHQWLRPRKSLSGLALQGAAVTGLVFLIP